MTQTAPRLRIKLRLEYDSPLILGPGKAELLSRIGRLGSISAAAREMGMSYKRAWTLVEEMNTAFIDPVIDSARGGAGGGGARVTPTGERVLAHYRALESLLLDAGATDLQALNALLRPEGAG
ncbi:LysR family transcriptional regulator [Paracoccus aestuarii]|uniref:LysR family transcriptional regulator n=1 Tax=Paracoccus aestuarii TaxID=453842 RepID=A0A418ZXQ1_9RHOB|nr:LysR family transcriptional regulator [Paracoccus aestuarii]RJL05280.1 LysR family transcriptional regulator [Paracoccus aestuarii]WCQ99137.1 LysR family transcriptional regulator [Paracoccus aestuarii]